MKLQTVPARRGALWVRQGFRAFFTRPMAFAALFAAFMFGVFVLALVPLLGPMLVLALLPLVSLAFMLATRVAVAGGLPTPSVFVAPLRADRPRVVAMLQLGLIYAVATYAVMALSDLVDGGAFEALMDAMPAGQSKPEVVAARLDAPGLTSGLLLRFGLAGLLAVPFWHAPALVYWDGHGCAKALFSSTLACWRNRGAFMVYSLVWFALILVFGMVGSLVFAMFGQSQVFAAAAVPLSLGVTTVFYVSLYFTFADCFVSGEPEPPLTPAIE
jgi:hypothetical protein